MDQMYINILYTLESIDNSPKTIKNRIRGDLRAFWSSGAKFIFPRATTGKIHRILLKKAVFKKFLGQNTVFWCKMTEKMVKSCSAAPKPPKINLE